MDAFLNGTMNFFNFIITNLTNIIAIVLFIIGVVGFIIRFCKKSKEEKIEYIKELIHHIINHYTMQAELDYSDWVSAGNIKRAQVIKKIYNDYPILEKVADQNEFIDWLDNEIDTSLQTINETFEKNTDE